MLKLKKKIRRQKVKRIKVQCLSCSEICVCQSVKDCVGTTDPVSVVSYTVTEPAFSMIVWGQPHKTFVRYVDAVASTFPLLSCDQFPLMPFLTSGCCHTWWHFLTFTWSMWRELNVQHLPFNPCHCSQKMYTTKNGCTCILECQDTERFNTHVTISGPKVAVGGPI